MIKKKILILLLLFFIASSFLYSAEEVIAIVLDGKNVYDLPVMSLGKKKYVSLNELAAFFKKELKGGLINWEPKVGKLELQVDSRMFYLFLDRNVVLVDEFLLDIDSSLILVQGEVFIPESFIYILDYFYDSFETDIENRNIITDLVEPEKTKSLSVKIEDTVSGKERTKQLEEKFDIEDFLDRIRLVDRTNIVIDPGHNKGREPGVVVANSESEAEITYKIARRCKEILEQDPSYQVILTRSENSYRSLDDRVSIVNAVKPELFISLQIAGSPDERLAGYSIYYYDEVFDNEVRKYDFNESSKKKIPFGLNYYEYQSKSKRLASVIDKEFSKSLIRRDSGITKAPLYMMKCAAVPSVMVEAGYLTNKGERQLLNSPEYIEKLARSVSAAIVDFFR